MREGARTVYYKERALREQAKDRLMDTEGRGDLKHALKLAGSTSQYPLMLANKRGDSCCTRKGGGPSTTCIDDRDGHPNMLLERDFCDDTDRGGP